MTVNWGSASKHPDAERGQQPLQDRTEADECDQNLEESREPLVANVLVDQVEHDRSDYDDDRDVDQDYEHHGAPLKLMRQYDTECATTLRKGGAFAATTFAVI